MTAPDSHQPQTSGVGQRRLLDAYAPQHDIAASRVVFVDAEPASVVAALDRLELGRAAVDATTSIGLGDRVAFGPEQLGAWGGRERVYGLAWRIDGDPAEPLARRAIAACDLPGYVKVIWDLRVEMAGDARTALSSTQRFVASDEAARERLRSGWGILGPLSTTISKRALGAVKRLAEEQEDDLAAVTPQVLLVAA